MMVRRCAAAVCFLAGLGLVTGACGSVGSPGAGQSEAMSPPFQPAESLHVDPPSTTVETLSEPVPPQAPSAQAFAQQLADTMQNVAPDDNFSDGECHGDRDLHIHLQGADGSPVSAQISADFKRGGTKIGEDGQPIPANQYSRLLYVNANDGTKDACLADIPDAEVFVEVYPKDFVDGAFVASEGKYGSVMWHGVWPGPGQTVNLTMPLACDSAAGLNGNTGAIQFAAKVDGKDETISRLVAWSRASASTRQTPGFGVADSAQVNADNVSRLDRLAPDQPYFVQVQTTDGQIMSYEPVPVSSCKDTNVVMTKTGSTCVITIDGGQGKPCTNRTDSVG
jgi:hypothetical protein